MPYSITIKDIDYEVLNRLNEEAKKRGVSVNMLSLQLLREAIGLAPKAHKHKLGIGASCIDYCSKPD